MSIIAALGLSPSFRSNETDLSMVDRIYMAIDKYTILKGMATIARKVKVYQSLSLVMLISLTKW